MDHGCDFHVGATTALEPTGHEHYLSLGAARDVYLFGEVPGWLTAYRSMRPFSVVDANFSLASRPE